MRTPVGITEKSSLDGHDDFAPHGSLLTFCLAESGSNRRSRRNKQWFVTNPFDLLAPHPFAKETGVSVSGTDGSNCPGQSPHQRRAVPACALQRPSSRSTV